jgi:alanine dehydrogenase
MKLRVFSSDVIRRAVPMAEAIEIVKQAFAQLSSGAAIVPLRTQLSIDRHEGIALFMPAYLRSSDQLGFKTVSVFANNLQLGIPTIHALVAVLDSETGRPAAILDGTYLTALRTGAASGAASDLLARRDARVAAVIGAGVQGRTALEAVCEARTIDKACVFDLDRGASETFAAEMRERGGCIPETIVCASDAREAVSDADIICTTTTSSAPVFDDSDLKAGAHINAAGAFTPDTREVPEETVQRARLFVDSREACWEEAGDLIIPRSKGLISEGDIHAELGEVVSGTKDGRTDEDEITFFKSVGSAVQDVAVAAKVLEEAGRLGLGTEVEL